MTQFEQEQEQAIKEVAEKSHLELLEVIQNLTNPLALSKGQHFLIDKIYEKLSEKLQPCPCEHEDDVLPLKH
jgi:molecular chaperone GrpE (heat shock protein)